MVDGDLQQTVTGLCLIKRGLTKLFRWHHLRRPHPLLEDVVH